jgi:nicotinate-nucleotide adenylyltransferase
MMHFKQPIGLFGGTFDPIHDGHLRTALELYQALNLAEVRFIPCYQPVHRKLPVATPEQRLAMVSAAIKNEPALTVDTSEIDREGPSYMIDTVKSLHHTFSKTPLCLIMGIDALLGFPSWHRWEEILNYVHLVVAHRPQYQLPANGMVSDLLKERLTQESHILQESLAGYILLHPVTALEISATDIRKQVMMGQNPRFLLPEAVYQYILEHGVYTHRTPTQT